MMNDRIISRIEELKIKKTTEITPSRHHYAYFIRGRELCEISKGENSFIKDKTCTTIHAEMDALQKILKWKECPKKVDLIVIKINKNGEIGDAKPCSHCINILHNNSKIKIQNVYYSIKNNNNFMIKEKFSKMKNNNINDKKILSKALRYKCGDKIYYD
jgi:deoxycytidylate deaminase